jgi:hypothetical protein
VSKHTDIDGMSQWEALNNEIYFPRKEVLGNIDDIVGYSSYIEYGWKYVNGTTGKGEYDGHYGKIPQGNGITDTEYLKRVLGSEVGQFVNLTEEHILRNRKAATIHCMEKAPLDHCYPLEGPCLFDIISDPCERNNVAKYQPKILSKLEASIEKYRATAARPRNKPSDPMAAPELNDMTWTWWREYKEL